ncbi:hypothetical protein GCM10009530_19890 [Microbispora corallina]|uniref:Lipoprotein n=1 Tax=Microbispora corallina TaxID=83302 RepID=A0ABQ4FU42_9ACTN|nr:hypothetical protein [Microbispora corallina]GIH38351.1 hypothetical protein Mco01_13510 [Microbispora corallina]
MEAKTMPGLSVSVRLRRIAVVLALVSFAPVACTEDDTPTAAQAGQTLKNHILQLLKERDAVDVRVTDAGGKDVACGEGRARRTFAATGLDTAGSTSSYILRTAMVGALNKVGHYQLVGEPRPGEPIRAADAESRTHLILDSPQRGIYSVTGETDCLRLSR